MPAGMTHSDSNFYLSVHEGVRVWNIRFWKVSFKFFYSASTPNFGREASSPHVPILQVVLSHRHPLQISM